MKLEDLAKLLGVQVRYEPTGGRSGAGVLHGEKVAVINSEQPLRERVEALAAVLAKEDSEHVYLPPVVRELLEKRHLTDSTQ